MFKTISTQGERPDWITSSRLCVICVHCYSYTPTTKLLYVFERKTSKISVLLYKAVVRFSTQNVPNISLVDKADVRLCYKEAPRQNFVCVFEHKTSKISV